MSFRGAGSPSTSGVDAGDRCESQKPWNPQLWTARRVPAGLTGLELLSLVRGARETGALSEPRRGPRPGNRLVHVLGQVAKPDGRCVRPPFAGRRDVWHLHRTADNQGGGNRRLRLDLRRVHSRSSSHAQTGTAGARTTSSVTTGSAVAGTAALRTTLCSATSICA